MIVLALTPAHNTPGINARTGKPWRDATGAFQPEARAFSRLHEGIVKRFDNSRPPAVRFEQAMETIGSFSGLRGIGLFCHGLKTGIQCGATIRNVQAFGWAIRAALTPGGFVALYACDAARDLDKDHADDLAEGPAGAGGFASELAAVLGPDHWVDAHVTTAHTTINPYVRRFQGAGAGDWIVDPKADPEKFRAWAAKLRDDQAFRLSFPFWDRARILASL